MKCKLLLLIVITGMLSACQSQLHAPCKNFGEWCSKHPVNTWYSDDGEVSV